MFPWFCRSLSVCKCKPGDEDWQQFCFEQSWIRDSAKFVNVNDIVMRELLYMWKARNYAKLIVLCSEGSQSIHTIQLLKERPYYTALVKGDNASKYSVYWFIKLLPVVCSFSFTFWGQLRRFNFCGNAFSCQFSIWSWLSHQRYEIFGEKYHRSRIVLLGEWLPDEWEANIAVLWFLYCCIDVYLPKERNSIL